MKKFQFRLARVQRLREHLRDQRERAYAQAVQYQQKVEAQIDFVEQVRQEEKSALRNELSKPQLSVDTVIRSRTFDGLLASHRTYLGRQHEQIRGVVASRREALIVAEREVRILEKLHERQRHRYDELVERSDAALMDELALRSVARAAELTALAADPSVEIPVDEDLSTPERAHM